VLRRPSPLADQGAVQVVAGERPDDIGGLIGREIVSEKALFLQVGHQAGLVGAAP